MAGLKPCATRHHHRGRRDHIAVFLCVLRVLRGESFRYLAPEITTLEIFALLSNSDTSTSAGYAARAELV
jgi:hypothetical protein